MRKIILGICLCTSVLVGWSVPAKRTPFVVRQPDGSQLTVVKQGDEFGHWYMTDDRVPLKLVDNTLFYATLDADNRIVATSREAHNSAARSVEEQQFLKSLPSFEQAQRSMQIQSANVQKARGIRQQMAEVPHSGKVNVLVLLVEFSNKSFSQADPKAVFENHLSNRNEEPESGKASVLRYFTDQSNGFFQPQFDVVGPIKLSNTMEYYGGNDEEGHDLRPREMVETACRLANGSTYNVDFSKYDNDKDGTVDVVYVLYAGYGEASNSTQLGNTIWPHQWQLATNLVLDGVQINKYACNNELSGWSGTEVDGIGVFCHEFSHCLGLPDFYDTGGTNCFGMNSWSLMGMGNYNKDGHVPSGYTGYEKDFMGWQPLNNLVTAGSVSLLPMSKGGEAYRIYNDANANEYYIVENHQQSGWDAGAGGHGMLVLHVDYRASAWSGNTVNTIQAHQRMTLIPADDKLTGSTLSGDPYPGKSGNTALTDESTPAAAVYTGEFMGKPITDISENDGIITFSFMKGALPVPEALQPQNLTANGFTACWKKVEGVDGYRLELNQVKESPYLLEEDFDKLSSGSGDIGSVMDDYTIQKGWFGRIVFGADQALQIGQSTKQGYLYSPYFESDSTYYTLFLDVKKCVASDKDVDIVVGVGDDSWGNSLVGFQATVSNDEWKTYSCVFDTIGFNSFLYMDTRGDGSKRVNIDNIYILPGDYSQGEEEEACPQRSRHAVQALPLRQSVEAFQKVGEATRSAASSQPRRTRLVDTSVTDVNLTDTFFTFKELDGGTYTYKICSVKDSVQSKLSNEIEVVLIDSMLEPTATPTVQMDNRHLVITAAEDGCTFYYTTDGSTPTVFSSSYAEPLLVNGKTTYNVYARKAGKRASEVVAFTTWFRKGTAYYNIISTEQSQVELTAAQKGNSGSDYAGYLTFGDSIKYQGCSYALVSIADEAFANAASLRAITLSGKHLHSVGKNIFANCEKLNAVVWDLPLPLPTEMFNGSYPNLLLYVPSSGNLPEGNFTAVVDGKASSLILDDRSSFYCPRSFVASTVTFERIFNQQTYLNAVSGWETLVLPFDVQTITHSTAGEAAPFGSSATGKKNFWLAGLTADGFKQTTTLKANQPCLLAFPNNSVYGENNLSGLITFSAAEVEIHRTDELLACPGNDRFEMVPTYETIEPADTIYALNVNYKYGVDYPGSVFAINTYTVAPFCAYVQKAGGAAEAPAFRIQVQTSPQGEEETSGSLQESIAVSGNILTVTLAEEKPIVVYDAAGRIVYSAQGTVGVNVIEGLAEGFYLVNQTKIGIKR